MNFDISDLLNHWEYQAGQIVVRRFQGKDGKEKIQLRVDLGVLQMDAFGRPDPNQDPPCERTGETSIVQALHLMNSENLYNKVTADNGRAAQWAASGMSPREIVEELYLRIYCRPPDEEEAAFGVSLFAAENAGRRQATEDLMWALFNTPEFVFKD